MDAENILIAVLAVLITFAKGMGSAIWAHFARRSIKGLLKEVGILLRKKISERKEGFLKKMEADLSANEAEQVEWIYSYVSGESLTEAIGVYKREVGPAIAFVFATLSCAVFLAAAWIMELTGKSYWLAAVFSCIFIAAACAGAWDRCFQCSLRTSDAWRKFDGDDILRAINRQGQIIKAAYNERQEPVIYVARDDGIQIILDVQKINIERAVDYILYGSG